MRTLCVEGRLRTAVLEGRYIYNIIYIYIYIYIYIHVGLEYVL